MFNKAGGTPGGIGSFFLGIIMFCGGVYMLLNSIVVTHMFGFGMGLFAFPIGNSYTTVTSGMVLIPFMFGVGFLFFNYRSIIGWILSIGAISALVFGVIANTHFSMRSMSLFDLLVILILTVGGLGVFLRSFRSK